MDDQAPYCDMPNGLAKDVNYKQQFVKAAPEHYPSNNQAKACPDANKVLEGMK